MKIPTPDPSDPYSILPASPKKQPLTIAIKVFIVVSIAITCGVSLPILIFVCNTTKLNHKFNILRDSSGIALNFAIAGFPKTGTTFLLKLLENHPEIVMPSEEFCDIHKGTSEILSWLKNASVSDLQTPNKQYGIKCPTMVRNTNAIDNLAKLSGDTRLIVGVRHPVLWFQSFYNYR